MIILDLKTEGNLEPDEAPLTDVLLIVVEARLDG